MRKTKSLLLGAGAAALAYHVLIGWGAEPATARAPAGKVAGPDRVAFNPEKNAYFGDLHLHTTLSFDSYMLMGTRTTPDEAYRFARGETIDYLGQPVHREVPLDFLAVTDHSENIGIFNQLDDPNSELSLTEIGKLARQGGIDNLVKVYDLIAHGGSLGAHANDVGASAWQREIDAANANYQPGKFTTFIAYEWTASGAEGANLHRNVIFRGNSAPAPYTSLNSSKPEDLWNWLAQIRGQGHEALAIAHNANASNGLMYDWNMSNGRPIDEAFAQLRATNEPLLEVAQVKGTSETHPALSGNDEFAGFELFDRFLNGRTHSKEPGSYWRDALGRGLVIGAKVGANPYKDGAVGGGDLHSGISVSSEADSGGPARANLGGGRPTLEQARHQLTTDRSRESGLPPIILSSAGLTGVWAEANTREALYGALRRKETFATSGTRLKVRFFGGWNFAPSLLRQRDWVGTAYRTGVPMGGDLPAPGASQRAPSFVVEAVKDPNSGNLDRIQVIKVWLESGVQKERVFDVAWSGNRRIDRKTGKLPAVGDTVDLKTGKYTNTIGAAALSKVWTDPTFRADQAAVYYVRVLEIPTPRWSTLRAIAYGLPLAKEVAPTLQERGWSSPIWYTPARRD